MLLLALTVLAAEPSWTLEGTHDGIEVFSREVPGSKFSEFQARAEVAASADKLCDAVFDWASIGKSSPEVKERTLLENHGDTRIVHDHLEAPVVSNRAVTFEIKKSHTPSGLCTITSQVQNAKSPKLPEGFVRIDTMRTSWEFEPAGGTTRVTFTLFVDPAGSIPAFLIFRAQKNGTVDTMKKAVALLR